MSDKSIITLMGDNINNKCENVVDILGKAGIKINVLKYGILKEACTFEFNNIDKNKIRNQMWLPLKNNLKIRSCELLIPDLFNGNIEKYLEDDLRPIYYK